MPCVSTETQDSSSKGGRSLSICITVLKVGREYFVYAVATNEAHGTATSF